jgi:23S rRNA (adenine2503-C2)-methyltransferase
MVLSGLYSHNYQDFKDYFKSYGVRPFLADQVYDWIYKKFEFNPEKWTNVSSDNKEFLFSHFSMELPKILWHGLSSDGTRKFLIKMKDQQTVEAVVIPGKSRFTLCLSSQVGCAMGCTFCHTATQGLKRHLDCSEVVGQYLVVTRWLLDHSDKQERLTNIVYMGQGEPLHNFENMKKATEIFLDPKGLMLGQRKITLSTSGLAPQIERLKEFPAINLAISLHSPRDIVRSQLMPINKSYNLERLFDAINKVPLKANRRITYEYLLIEGLTDTQEDLDLLCDMLHRKESKINLIPFNEFPDSIYKRPTDKKIMEFNKKLIERGFTSTIRVTKGEDILAACGQLKSTLEKLNVWDDNEKIRVEDLKKKSMFSFASPHETNI